MMTHFPGNVDRKMLKPLIVLGSMLILIGGILIVFRDMAERVIHLGNPLLAGLVCIAIGVLFLVIIVISLILKETWELRGVHIRSKKNQTLVSLGPDSPELATDIDLNVNGEKTEETEFQKSTRFKRGDTVEIQLKLRSLKSMEIINAYCTLLVEQRSKFDIDHLKTVYKKRSEDITSRSQMVKQNQTIMYRFEHLLPRDQESSSYDTIWTLRFDIRARGAANFLQDISLSVT